VKTPRTEAAAGPLPPRARPAAGAARAGAAEARAAGVAVPAPRRTLWLASALFVVLALLFCGYFFRSLRAALQGEEALALRALAPQVLDRPATDLTLEDEAGRPVTLSSFKGKPIFLNFWATWCGPCRDEAPSVEAMIQEMTGKGLTVLLVSTDDTWDDVRRFYGGRPSGGLVLRDPGAKGAHSYGTFKYPETYLIDPSFVVKHRFIGPRNWASEFALRYLQQLL